MQRMMQHRRMQTSDRQLNRKGTRWGAWLGAVVVQGLLVLPIALVGGSPVAAQTSACQDPQDQTTMNRCAYESWERADRALNQTYQSAIARLNPAQQQQLVGAQQAWISFRDRHCAFAAGDFEGGSMQPLIEWSCKDSITQERLNDLQAYRRGTTVPARGQSLAASDAALNRVYQVLLRSQSGSQRSRLIAAEEAWIRFRDRACAFERNLQPTGDRCAIRLSDARTADLEAAVNHP